MGKDYAYRSTWKHKYSRAKNLAHRGGMTKENMYQKHGRFPKRTEWWGPEENEKEWTSKYILQFPKPKSEKNEDSKISAAGKGKKNKRGKIIKASTGSNYCIQTSR